MSHYFIRGKNDQFRWMKTPSLKSLEKMMFDGVAKTPEGDKVEPDHPRAWPSLLGFV
jgi:hypothetical protein